MKKTILTLLGSALVVTATVQLAGAAQQGRKVHRAPAATSEQFRNSNAAWPQQQVQSGYWSRYLGGYSAPAGR